MRPERRRIGYVPQEGASSRTCTVAGEHRLRAPARGSGAAARASCSSWSGSPAWSAATPTSSPAASSSASRSPAHSRSNPRSCCWTSRSPRSTRTCARACATTSSTILREAATTTLLVTHDQDEALSLADHVAVLRDGKIVQYAPPHELYADPVDERLARFIGDANLIDGVMRTVVDTPLGLLAGRVWDGDRRQQGARSPCCPARADRTAPLGRCARPPQRGSPNR